MCDWLARGMVKVAKRNNGPALTGPSSLVERRTKLMFRVNMRFNLAIRLPLKWIAALFYLLK